MTTAVKGVKIMADEQIVENQANENGSEGLGNDNVENADKQPKTYTQEELDALIKEAETKGFVKGKTDTNIKWEKKAAEREKIAKEEAEKQARFEKMSALQRAEEEAKDAKSQLQALEDKIALNEQKEETRKLMKDKGLPDSFLDAVLVFKDAEATLAKIEEFKALFDAEVQKAVEGRISTTIPKQNTVQPKGIDMNAYRERMLSH